MRLKIDFDSETAARLVEDAVRNRRPADRHAEVLLRAALGLPVLWPQRAGSAPAARARNA